MAKCDCDSFLISDKATVVPAGTEWVLLEQTDGTYVKVSVSGLMSSGLFVSAGNFVEYGGASAGLDGNYRTGVVGGAYVTQKLITGTWTTLESIS